MADSAVVMVAGTAAGQTGGAVASPGHASRSFPARPMGAAATATPLRTRLLFPRGLSVADMVPMAVGTAASAADTVESIGPRPRPSPPGTVDGRGHRELDFLRPG